MSEPTLYRIEPDAATTGQQIRAVDDAIQDGVLVPVEPDYEAMATVMNVDGWTCDGHEPGAWCEDCKRLQLSTTRKMWNAGIGGDDE
jgi:hypothetical protein